MAAATDGADLTTEQKRLSMLSPAAARQLQEMSISVASGAETIWIRLLTFFLFSEERTPHASCLGNEAGTCFAASLSS